MLSCPSQTFPSFYYLTVISSENNSLLQGGRRASHNQISLLNALYKSTQVRDPPQSLHHWQPFSLPPHNVLPGLQQDPSDVEVQINAGSTPQKLIGILGFDFSHHHHWSRNFSVYAVSFGPRQNTVTFISPFLIYSSYAPAISHSESQESSQQKKGSCFAFIFPNSISSDWKLC